MEIFRLFGTILIQGNGDEALRNLDEQGQAAHGRLADLGKAVGALALSLGAMGVAAVGALGVKSVKVADEFRRAMNGLAAETEASVEEMEGFEESTKRIYNNNLGENFEDIAKAMAKVKQTTGETGEELENLTSNALMLRDTFEMDVEGSINTVNSLVKQFGITGEEAYTLIAQGAQNGANKNGDLLDVLNEYAPQFKAMGYNAEEFTNILINGANEGAFQVDKVGDAIKEFNIRIKDGSESTSDSLYALFAPDRVYEFADALATKSKTSAEYLELVGIAGKEAADYLQDDFAKGGKAAEKAMTELMRHLGEGDRIFNGLAEGSVTGKEALEEVIVKLQEIEDPVYRGQLAVSLFGTQFEDLEFDAIVALGNTEGAANKAADTLEKMNNIKYDSFTHAIQGIGRQFETGLLLPLGEKILPKLNELAAWVNEKMPQIEKQMAGILSGTEKAFNGFASAIKFVVDNLNFLLPALAGVTAAILGQMVVNTVVAVYAAWKTATTTMTTAQWLLNAAMSANPIGMVAIAIGALIAAGIALYMNWEQVSAFLSESWVWIKETAVSIWTSIEDFFTEWWQQVTTLFTETFTAFIEQISTYWNEIKNFTLEIWNGILKFFTEDVPAGFERFITFFRELPGKINAFLYDLFFVKIPYAVGYAIGWIIQAASEGIPKFVKFFADLPGKVWEWLVKLYTDFSTWHADMKKEAIATGSAILTAIVNFFAELPGKVFSWLVSTVSRLNTFKNDATVKAKETGKSILDSIIDFVMKLPETIATWFTSTVSKIGSFVKGTGAAARDVGKAIFDGIVDYIKDIPEKVEELVGGIVGKIKDIAGNIKGAISSIFNAGKAGIEAGAVSAGGKATITVPAYATGTSFAPGGLSLVGEKGAELVNLPRGAQVFPADETARMLQDPASTETVIELVLDGQKVGRGIVKHVNKELANLAKAAGRKEGVIIR